MPLPERSADASDEPDLRREDRPFRSPSLKAHLRQLHGLIALLLGMSLVGAGCDPSVQAFQSSPQHHYSIFGVLNPAQDTQWVRVEPLPEPTSGGAPSDLGATVTLRNLETGQAWTLRDSLMEVFRGEFQHNFWTTAPIALGTTYRLVVSDQGGNRTTATTTTPATPPSLAVRGAIYLPCDYREDKNVFEVHVRDTNELAALRVRYFQTYAGTQLTFDFDAYDDATKAGDQYMALINYLHDLQTTNQTVSRECIADSAHVVAYAGGPDWPEWAHYNAASISQLAQPDTFTNVQGGLGMFSGVYPSDTVTVEVRRRQF